MSSLQILQHRTLLKNLGTDLHDGNMSDLQRRLLPQQFVVLVMHLECSIGTGTVNKYMIQSQLNISVSQPFCDIRLSLYYSPTQYQGLWHGQAKVHYYL